MSDDSALHEKPLEFLASIANTGGDCDGQAILPEDGRYRCTCSCGHWDVAADDAQEGLRQARLHTGSVPGRAHRLTRVRRIRNVIWVT